MKIEKRGSGKVSQSAGTEEIIELEPGRKSSKVSKAGEAFELAKDSGQAGSRPSGGKSPSSKTRAKKPSDSEFELKLGADSSDEFELTLADEGSDEVDLGAMPRDATGNKGKSGVNLKNPADSGISLESKGKRKDAESDSEFELNLDSSKTSKVSGPKSSSRKKKADSDSEFELMRTMWNFHQPANKASSTLTRGVAGMFVGENELPKD